MSRKQDLESHIRETNKLIREYEDIIRLSDSPKEKARARRSIDELKGLIEGHLSEYSKLCENLKFLVPEDINEIALTQSVHLSKPKRVDLAIDGEFNELTQDLLQGIVANLAVSLKITSNDIRVLKTYQGSIVIAIELPNSAANRLYKMARERDARLVNLGIKSVLVEGQEVVKLVDTTATLSDIRHERLTLGMLVEGITTESPSTAKASGATAKGSFANAHALLIGVGNYQHEKYVDLPITVKDAQTVEAILINADRCGYEDANVRLITGEHATAENIRAALQELAQATNDQSTVFIYFSGHGGRALENGNWKPYLCLREADPDDLTHTAISGDEFGLLLKDIPYARMLLILDACHSAGSVQFKSADDQVIWKSGLPDSYYETLGRGRGRIALASSKEDQRSYVLSKYDTSLFTHHLLEALDGKAAVRGDGLIHIMDVFHHVSETVRADQPAQEPFFKGETDLNFAIALDLGGKGTGGAKTTPKVEAIRDQIVQEPLAGALALSEYLKPRPEWTVKRTEVDMKRSELENIQHELDLFGPDPALRVSKNRVVYFLLRTCLELEQKAS